MIPDPEPEHIGVQAVTQRGGCDRYARLPAGLDDLHLEFRAVPPAPLGHQIPVIVHVHVSTH